MFKSLYKEQIQCHDTLHKHIDRTSSWETMSPVFKAIDTAAAASVALHQHQDP